MTRYSLRMRPRTRKYFKAFVFLTFARNLSNKLINCKIELDLTSLRNCVTSEILRTPEVIADSNAYPPVQEADSTQTKGAIFKINSPVITSP